MPKAKRGRRPIKDKDVVGVIEVTAKKSKPDMVNDPPHYTMGGIGTRDFIEAKGLDKDHCLSNVIEYVVRSSHKGTELQDLEKAEWNLKRKITNLKKSSGEKPTLPRTDMVDVVNFCEGYNLIGQGEAEIIETKSAFVVTLYNAGFSENEELDGSFRQKYGRKIVHEMHPIIIAVFLKCVALNYDNMKDWCDCYQKQDNYKYSFEVE